MKKGARSKSTGALLCRRDLNTNDDMEGKQLLVFTCLVSCLFAINVYDLENIHVENEDGTTQIFEVKRLEPMSGEACAICSQNTVNSSPRLAPIRSNVFIAVGEVATECGKIKHYFLSIFKVFQIQCFLFTFSD